jgi:phosphotransferase system  glucose/maltose/N-acetylglucosamine-specific IIC component
MKLVIVFGVTAGFTGFISFFLGSAFLYSHTTYWIYTLIFIGLSYCFVVLCCGTLLKLDAELGATGIFGSLEILTSETVFKFYEITNYLQLVLDHPS